MSASKSDEVRDHFSVADILRLVSGVLLFNALASWWFTSSTTWGYHGKWINPRYVQHVLFERNVDLTIKELSRFDGNDPSAPIYIAINGSVYDVTSAPEIYGPGGPYRFFSGKDAARAFVTGCFQNPDEFTYDLRGLDPGEAANDIKSWQDYFDHSDRYWYVGTVHHDPVTGDPPPPCKHMKYPNH